jgi:hypothetical protein
MNVQRSETGILCAIKFNSHHLTSSQRVTWPRLFRPSANFYLYSQTNHDKVKNEEALSRGPPWTNDLLNMLKNLRLSRPKNSLNSDTCSFCTLADCAEQAIPENADDIDKGDLKCQGHEFEVDDLHGGPDIIIGFQGGEITLSRNQSLSTKGGDDTSENLCFRAFLPPPSARVMNVKKRARPLGLMHT